LKILIAGPSGIGKSRIKEKLLEKNYGIMIEDFSTKLVSIQKEYFKDKKFIDLSESERKLLRDETFKQFRYENMIIFGHMSYMVLDDGNLRSFELGYPIEYQDFFDQYILIKSDPEIIKNNRIHDENRERVTNINLIHLEIKIERAYLSYVTNNNFIEIEYNNKLNQFINKFNQQQYFQDMND